MPVSAHRWGQAWIGLGVALEMACAERLTIGTVSTDPAEAALPGASHELGRYPVFPGARSTRPRRGNVLGDELWFMAGSYEAHVVGLALASGSDLVRFTVEESGASRLVFGERAFIHAIPDPQQPFPPEHAAAFPLDEAPVFDGVVEGFEYLLQASLVEPDADTGGHGWWPRFAGNSFDPFTGWCALQTRDEATSTCAPPGYPVPAGNGVDCNIYETEAFLDGALELIDQMPCFRFDICMQRCACDEHGCGAWQVADLSLETTPWIDYDFADDTESEVHLDALLSLTWPPITQHVLFRQTDVPLP